MTVSFAHHVRRPLRSWLAAKMRSWLAARRWLSGRKWFDESALNPTLILAALFMSVWMGALVGLAVLFARRI